MVKCQGCGSNFVKDLHEQVSSLQAIQKTPVVLPCGHTVCVGCGKLFRYCPTCHNAIKSSADVVINKCLVERKKAGCEYQLDVPPIHSNFNNLRKSSAVGNKRPTAIWGDIHGTERGQRQAAVQFFFAEIQKDLDELKRVSMHREMNIQVAPTLSLSRRLKHVVDKNLQKNDSHCVFHRDTLTRSFNRPSSAKKALSNTVSERVSSVAMSPRKSVDKELLARPTVSALSNNLYGKRSSVPRPSDLSLAKLRTSTSLYQFNPLLSCK